MRVDIVIQAFADDLLLATTLSELGGATAKLAKTFGFEFFIVADTGKEPGRVGPALIYAIEPADALERFELDGPLAAHPMFSAARRSASPVTISAIKAQMQIDGEVWSKSLPPWFAQCDGIVMGIESTNGRSWFLAFAGAAPTVNAKSCSVLHVAAELAFRRCEEILTNADRSTLTSREGEAVALLTAGWTDREAAQSMQISGRTLRFHIDNAKKKLGVTSRAQVFAQVLRREFVARSS